MFILSHPLPYCFAIHLYVAFEEFQAVVSVFELDKSKGFGVSRFVLLLEQSQIECGEFSFVDDFILHVSLADFWGKAKEEDLIMGESFRRLIGMGVAFLMMVLSIWSVSSFSHATISPVSSIVPLLFAVSLVSSAIVSIFCNKSALSAIFVGETAERHFAILV